MINKLFRLLFFSCCLVYIVPVQAQLVVNNLDASSLQVLEELIVTDSVPNIKPHSKIKVLSCADLFSDVMHKVHNNKSISSNFIM